MFCPLLFVTYHLTHTVHYYAISAKNRPIYQSTSILHWSWILNFPWAFQEHQNPIDLHSHPVNFLGLLFLILEHTDICFGCKWKRNYVTRWKWKHWGQHLLCHCPVTQKCSAGHNMHVCIIHPSICSCILLSGKTWNIYLSTNTTIQILYTECVIHYVCNSVFHKKQNAKFLVHSMTLEQTFPLVAAAFIWISRDKIDSDHLKVTHNILFESLSSQNGKENLAIS